MHAFNLTRLNFHSPYKVWIDNGSYKFLTDYGVQYRIEFVENNNIWEDEKAYEFGILNENKKNSPNDSKVKATIQCIIEEFFLTNPDILLYQCERVIADRLCELAFLPDGLTNSINEIVFVSRFLFLGMKKLTIT